MSAEDRSRDDDRPYAGRVQQAGPSGAVPVTQAEIDDVLNDARLSPDEREARLQDLRQRILDDEHADGLEQYAPLQTQIMDALSMLAEGGHDYDGSLRVEADRDAEDELPDPADESPDSRLI